MVKKSYLGGSISGVKTYFPGLHSLNPGFFTIDKSYPYTVAGCASEFSFRSKIQSLYIDDFHAFYKTLIELEYQVQIETLDLIISEIRGIKSKLIGTFSHENEQFDMFLRPEIIKRNDNEIEQRNRILFEVKHFASVFNSEIDGFIRKLERIRDDIEIKSITGSPVSKGRFSRSSFSYIKYNTDSGRLTKLRNHLIKKNFILDCPQASFDMIFSGDQIKDPIRWNKNLNELHYFIDLLNTDKLLSEVVKHPWALAVKCFVKSDGTFFNKDHLRDARDIPASANDIKKIIRLL